MVTSMDDELKHQRNGSCATKVQLGGVQIYIYIYIIYIYAHRNPTKRKGAAGNFLEKLWVLDLEIDTDMKSHLQNELV